MISTDSLDTGNRVIIHQQLNNNNTSLKVFCFIFVSFFLQINFSLLTPEKEDELTFEQYREVSRYCSNVNSSSFDFNK